MGAAVLALSVLALALAIATATANHGSDRHVSSLIGMDQGNHPSSPNVPGGAFQQIRDVAIYTAGDADPSNDRVFTVENDSFRIQRLDLFGRFERMWGKDTIAGNPGTGYEVCIAPATCKSGAQGTSDKGEFDDPTAVAVDQADPTLGGAGSVYVYDRNNKRVQKFDLDGNFILMFGDNVNQTTSGDVCTEESGDTCQIGSGGTAAGQIGPSGSSSLFPSIAVDPTTHSVYVADPSNRRVQQFDPSGGFERLWGWDVSTSDASNGFEVCDSAADCKATGTAGTENGRFANNEPVELSVDEQGVVYASDSNLNNRVMRFDSTEAAAGDMLGTEITTPINETQTLTFTAPWANGDTFKIGNLPGSCSATETDPITYSTTGSTRATNIRNALEAKCGAANFAVSTAAAPVITFQGVFAATNVPTVSCAKLSGAAATCAISAVTDGRDGPLLAGGTDGLAGGEDNVFVLRIPSGSGANARVQEIDPAGTAQLSLSPPPSDTVQFGTIGFLGNQSRNLAVNPLSGDLYVPFRGGSANPYKGVFVLDEDGFNPPLVEFGAATDVTESAATVSATFDAQGAAEYSFEYSKNGADWTQLPPANAFGLEEVSAQLTDLEANTLYRVRASISKVQGPGVTTTNSAGFLYTDTSDEAFFVTDAAAPTAETLSIAARTDSSAKLVGRVNPNGTLTSYRFQWGLTTGYGNQVPIPAGNAGMTGTPVFVFGQIDGLEPDTTYHYRVVAQSPEGTATGDDMTFTTRATPPAEGARAYEMVTPPFKVARGTGSPQLRPNNNPNLSVPSLDGEKAHWTIHLFPLTDDVQHAMAGDKRIIRRSDAGWVDSTRNTATLLGDPEDEAGMSPSWFTTFDFAGSSGDFETVAMQVLQNDARQAGLLPTEGKYANRFYTRRDGTGVGGFTPWLENPEEQIVGHGFSPDAAGSGGGGDVRDTAAFNDDGSAMARWGYYRGLAGPGDPSVDQLPGPSGGASAYLQRGGDADAMPTAAKQPIAECTGTNGGGDATQLPARIGTGAATDTIGTGECWAADGAVSTGTGDLTNGSATVTNVSTSSGAFAVGQLISGQGIVPRTRITAVGAGTLTLSASAAASASGFATVTAGSPTITLEFSNPAPFVVGEPITGAGIPAGTTLIAKSGSTFTLSQNATASGEFVTVAQGIGPDTALEAHFPHLVSLRGATVGANHLSGNGNHRAHNNAGTSATALSDDGRRVYFQSPDWEALGAPVSACATGTGPNSSCVAQLFIRSHDSDGDPAVRWVSRSRSVPDGQGGYGGAMIAAQQVALLGSGVAFQGASRDGSVVYFKTNAPLTPDDPNGTGTPGPKTTGSASNSSFDLYRYELPADPDADPDAGTLTRISGGPDGTADPSTNVAGGDATLRFHSDDGSKAYFLTTAPIPGALNEPPAGGSTTPGGAVGNTSVRNLYLFDDDKTGAERYRFIARLPYFPAGTGSTTQSEGLNSCASSAQRLTDQLGAYQDVGVANNGSCWRGTADGRAVAFATLGQLSADDADQAGDVYHYDADADELVRVSAPPPGAEPYGCNLISLAPFGADAFGNRPTDPAWINTRCNAELGRNTGVQASRNGVGLASPIGSWETDRGWGGMRYYNLARNPDGSASVFFGSQLALVPEDTNNVLDVYQWRAGELSLISPGNSPFAAFFAGNSTDGRDVFFQTGQRIDPREIDDSDLDIYDARIGGGFPYTPPPAPCNVLAFECESEATSGPASRAAATAGFSGTGNVGSAAARCNKNQVRRGKRCLAKLALARRACAKRKGKAKRRCVRSQVQRLTKVQKRQQRARTANANRRAAR